MKNWNKILDKFRTTINNKGIDSFHVLEELVPIRANGVLSFLIISKQMKRSLFVILK